jgi:hypothetical protein
MNKTWLLKGLAPCLLLLPFVSQGATDTFTYDVLGRLKSAKYGDSSAENYFYDPAGNRLSSGATAGAPKPVAFTLVSSTGPTSVFKNPNGFGVVPTASGQIVNGAQGYTGITSNSCAATVAANGTCTIVIYTNTAPCRVGSYATQAYVTVAGVTVLGANIPKPCQN